MALLDAGIGDEEFLRAKPEPDALRYSGEQAGKRRAGGAVENPKRAEMQAPQERHEPDHIKPAPELGARMLEIDRLGDARLGRQELLRAARRRRQKRHWSARGGRGDGADER